jgi:hypothetical protein
MGSMKEPQIWLSPSAGFGHVGEMACDVLKD